MDLSVFNLLMSTTPSVSNTETPFSNTLETNGVASSVQAQENLRTGEAFLKVLEQVRNGKTERSAETFFNTMSARADASSSLKDFKTDGKSHEDVKVVKLHIKRTRASEKLQKAQENPSTTTEQTENRQKIPAQENIAPTEQTQFTAEQQSVVQPDTDQPVMFTQEGSKEFVEVPQNNTVSCDELTTADILINAALQTQTVYTQTQQVPVSDKQDTTVFQTEQTTQPVETHQESPVLDNVLKTETPDIIQTQPKAQSSVPVKQDVSPIQPSKKTFSVEQPVFKETNEMIRTDLSEQTNDFVFVKETAVTENVSAPVVSEKTVRPEQKQPETSLKQNNPVEHLTADTEFVADIENDFVSAPQKESRRQAADLAAKLPADVKIAVTVETDKTMIASLAPVRSINEKHVTGKRENTNSALETPLFANEDISSAQTEKPLHFEQVKSVSKNTDQPVTEKQPVQNFTNGLAALPVEQKSFAQTSSLTETATSVQNTTTPTTQNAPGFIQIGQELKGKAVSGSAVVTKHVPLNELADQIKVNIKKALKAGLDKIDVVVKHKDLGTIKVHLEIDKEGNMKAVLSSARSETLDLLRMDLSGLKQSLADSGFNMNDDSFSFNYRGERYEEKDEHRQHHHTETGIDEEEENVSEIASVSHGSGLYALNIRV